MRCHNKKVFSYFLDPGIYYLVLSVHSRDLLRLVFAARRGCAGIIPVPGGPLPDADHVVGGDCHDKVGVVRSGDLKFVKRFFKVYDVESKQEKMFKKSHKNKTQTEWIRMLEAIRFRTFTSPAFRCT